MNFGWGKAALLAAVLLAGCGQAAPVDPSAGKAEAAAFMAKNAKEEGVQTLPSGLQYKVIQSGPPGGESPDRNDLVKVDYEGTLTDGSVFDSSFSRGQPYVTTAEQVVPGWTEALQRIIAFVGEYSDAAKATAAFTAELKALDLFQTINIEIRSPDRATSNFSGFAAVSEERLNALPDETWLDLRRKGYLAPIHAHLISLMNFALLGERPQ